jgi:hypothetical protein
VEPASCLTSPAPNGALRGQNRKVLIGAARSIGPALRPGTLSRNGFVALPASDRQNLTMRALIIKVLIGIAIGVAIILVFVLFAHSTTPV